jgi:hypothetical protein
VGLKRHELLGKHAFPVKSELDVTGRQDDTWLQSLTDEELETLESLKRQAIERKAPQALGIRDATVLITGCMSSISDTTSSVQGSSTVGQDEGLDHDL